MTALLLYEKKGLAGSMKITAADTGVEPSHVPLIAGETVSISDLVHALLISSDNDAAMALARYVAGSSTAFVDLMNQRAIDLGCTRTHFANPNGLPRRTSTSPPTISSRSSRKSSPSPSCARSCG